MPETEDTTVETAEPVAYTFPFPVPDLATQTADELRALHTQVREHAASLTGESPDAPSDDTVAALRACRDLAVEIAGELNGRRGRSTEAATLTDEIDASLDDPEGDEDEPAEDTPEPEPAAAAEPAPAAVTAAGRRTVPTARQVARHGRPPQLPADAAPAATARMTMAADVGGFSSGQDLPKFADVAKALTARLDLYPALSTSRATGKFRGDRRPVTVYDPEAPGRQFSLRNYTRHQVVEFRRELPAELRVRDGDTNGMRVAEYAASERRLPGGSLIKSAEKAVAAGRSLTAAAGWCAPSEIIYDLMELETLDGMLDLPEIQTTRGGWQIPDDGGPDFATIYNSLGNSGDTHLTETEVINDTEKVCTEIPCPDFSDVRLGVDYYCLTGGLLQRRGYPEVVARFARGSVVALAHKINAGVIAAIVAASGSSVTLTADPNGDDAASALMAAVELAIVDAKYRNRMGFNTTMEVVLPWWVLVPIRAALSRRTGVAMLAVTDAQILEWFAIRKAVPRFVYDWQDSAAGLSGGPGAATPLHALPSTVQFLVYPAGTWVKAVQDVVALDTIYDSTLLSTNQFTAVFAEDGWATLKMGPISRLYTVPVDPSGVVGCCSVVGS